MNYACPALIIAEVCELCQRFDIALQFVDVALSRYGTAPPKPSTNLLTTTVACRQGLSPRGLAAVRARACSHHPRPDPLPAGRTEAGRRRLLRGRRQHRQPGQTQRSTHRPKQESRQLTLAGALQYAYWLLELMALRDKKEFLVDNVDPSDPANVNVLPETGMPAADPMAEAVRACRRSGQCCANAERLTPRWPVGQTAAADTSVRIGNVLGRLSPEAQGSSALASLMGDGWSVEEMLLCAS